jgi:hypothetical protein
MYFKSVKQAVEAAYSTNPEAIRAFRKAQRDGDPLCPPKKKRRPRKGLEEYWQDYKGTGEYRKVYEQVKHYVANPEHAIWIVFSAGFNAKGRG